ncbi:hypothetical protein [Actinomadura sp. WMMA1423]|uniref:hypothetical protein n=1 Tax=Actinomadura sp. WMMA1423 TaxID=2591108 RepID=UPI001146F1BA|nr:hypothetical protein [Actinomadura sp. WMMA1423]
MTMRRMLAMTGGAVVPMALLALIFGNQWVVEEIDKSHIRFDAGIGPVVTWLLTLAWRITPSGGLGVKQVVLDDLSLLVFFGVLVALVVAGARLADPERGPFGALIIGWWAAVVAGGVSGVVAAPLTRWAFEFQQTPFGSTFSSTVGQGASFGFAFGWLAGVGALGGFLLTRPRLAGAIPGAPYAPGGPYPAQQGMPMGQQPYPQQMQPHPSAVPYVPPQGQPQQPVWGAAPGPQQPPPPGQAPPPGQPQQPGAFGVPPVPPQPSAPPQEQEAPAAGEDPEGQEEKPEEAPEEQVEPPKEPEEPKEPEDGAADAREDAPEEDDLDLADRTVIDRRRDDET